MSNTHKTERWGKTRSPRYLTRPGPYSFKSRDRNDDDDDNNDDDSDNHDNST